MAPPVFVVFGATGPVGTALVESLSQRHPDADIRAVSRSGPESKCRLADMQLPNVKLVAGDAGNSEQCLALVAGAERVYSAIGFSEYVASYWAKHWPPVIHNLLAATKAADATFIFADNLYAYGPGNDVSTSSTKAVEASLTSKPAVRATLHATLREAIQAGTKIIVVGAADFFGPHVEATSFLGDTVAGKIAAGKNPMAIGSAQALHSFCYVGDFAEAVSVASDQKDAVGHFWIAPHAVQNKSLTDVALSMKKCVDDGDPPPKFSVLSPFVVSLLGFFVPFMREMKEMMPWWTADYVVRDDTEQFKKWGMEPIGYDEAVQQTMDFFKSRSAE